MEEQKDKDQAIEEAEIGDFELEKDIEFSQSDSKDVVSELRKKLRKSEQEKREYLLGWQRTKADYINSKKQDDEATKSLIKFAEIGLMSDLVAVLDSFDVAIVKQKDDQSIPKEWKDGMEQIYNQLLKILKDRGLEVIDTQNSTFDPRLAEAVGVTEVQDEEQDGRIVSVLQKGYKVKDRVLRPAKVMVGKYS